MSRLEANFTIYTDDEARRPRVVLEMKGVTEAEAPREAIPLLVEASAPLRSSEASPIKTIA